MRVKSEEKRQAILAVAADVFRESGFERASMSEICSRVGGSKATIYNYFSSKEELFFEVMYRSTEAEFCALHAALNAQTDDVVSELRVFGAKLISLLLSPEVMDLRRLIVSEIGRSKLGCICYDRGPQRCFSMVVQFLSAIIERGQLRACDPVLATKQFRALLEAEYLDTFFFQVPCDDSPEGIQQAVSRAVEVFMYAYGPSK